MMPEEKFTTVITLKELTDDVSVIINTSTEHMTQEEYDEWLELFTNRYTYHFTRKQFFQL